MRHLTIPELEQALAVATLRAEKYAATYARANARAEGILGNDMAVVSGIRRKPNPRADARRWATYDKAAEAERAARESAEKVAALTRQIERAQRDAAAVRDLDSLSAGDLVRNDVGWHRVVRVNAKSVTVETPWSWTDRISLARIIETRPVA